MLQSELGRLLQEAGAWNAQNLDGGGSSELIARAAGASSMTIRNVPSDGQERTDANSVGLFVTPGDGTARTLLLDPDGDATRSSGAPARVFAGLQRRFRVATAVDAGWGPAPLPSAATWSTSGGTIGSDGKLRAPDAAGRLTVTATAGAATGSTAVTVLDAPVRLEPSSRAVAFATASSSAANVTLTGRDADGHTAPVDAADATSSYDRAVVTVGAASDGRLRVTPRAAGATAITVTAGDAVAQLTVTIGAARAPALDDTPPADRLVAADDDLPADWSFAALAATDLSGSSGEQADATTQALARIRATSPDFVLVNGVTAGGGDGQALAARDVLSGAGCQLVTAAIDPPAGSGGKVSCVVLPGDGDRSGGALSTTYTSSFGPASRVFDHKRTRFVLLDSSAGTLLGASGQLDALDAALEGAATDGSLDAVVVATHRPPADPLGDSSRQLTDPRETTLLERALADFARTSGKPVTLLSGGGRTAAVRHVEGVAELALPTLGTPRGTSTAGGFSGWTRLTVDGDAPDGLVADVRPAGDAIALDAAQTVAADASIPLAATVTQDRPHAAARLPGDAALVGLGDTRDRLRRRRPGGGAGGRQGRAARSAHAAADRPARRHGDGRGRGRRGRRHGAAAGRADGRGDRRRDARRRREPAARRRADPARRADAPTAARAGRRRHAAGAAGERHARRQPAGGEGDESRDRPDAARSGRRQGDGLGDGDAARRQAGAEARRSQRPRPQGRQADDHAESEQTHARAARRRQGRQSDRQGDGPLRRGRRPRRTTTKSFVVRPKR